MNKLLRQIFALVLCVGILAPIAEKSTHSWEHRNDIHCTSGQNHFHNLEHSCSVCDYDQPVQESSTVFFSFDVFSGNPYYQNNYNAFFSSDFTAFSSPRAPPHNA